MLHRPYTTSPLMNLWPTNSPIYCNIGPTPAVFVLFEGYVRLRQFLGRALRLGKNHVLVDRMCSIVDLALVRFGV